MLDTAGAMAFRPLMTRFAERVKRARKRVRGIEPDHGTVCASGVGKHLHHDVWARRSRRLGSGAVLRNFAVADELVDDTFARWPAAAQSPRPAYLVRDILARREP